MILPCIIATSSNMSLGAAILAFVALFVFVILVPLFLFMGQRQPDDTEPQMTSECSTSEFCPQCMAETDCAIIRRMTTINFMGKQYEAEEEFTRCLECQREFDVFGQMDPLKQVYDEYRKEQGYPTPEEIRAIRRKAGLDEKQFAHAIGTTVTTIRLYENGALPRKEHAERIMAFNG